MADSDAQNLLLNDIFSPHLHTTQQNTLKYTFCFHLVIEDFKEDPLTEDHKKNSLTEDIKNHPIIEELKKDPINENPGPFRT